MEEKKETRYWKGQQPSPEDLRQIREDHFDWLESDQDTNPPHNLSGAILRNADMSEFHLDRIDLSRADLAKANLKKVSLINADLEFAQLQLADLRLTNMSSAVLCHADLSGASLFEADLSQADLSSTWLNETDLRQARLSAANLTAAVLSKAILHKAKLVSAKLCKATLTGADLREAELIGAKLIGAHLPGANLSGANLGEADLSDSDLLNANLSGAKLFKANLNGSRLKYADLSEADVTAVQYEGLKSCRGIRADTCYGSPRFKRHVMDMDYIEEMKDSEWKKLVWLWWATSDYGRSLKRWIILAAIIVAAFAGIFFALGEGSIKLGPNMEFTPLNMLYYSLVTFASVGMSGLEPLTTAARWWIMAEWLLGYVMLAGLIAIFLDKFARRAG